MELTYKFLKDLEYIVNVDCRKNLPESQLNLLLSLQIHELCVGFDVLLESDQTSRCVEGPREFPQGRVFARMTAYVFYINIYYTKIYVYIILLGAEAIESRFIIPQILESLLVID